MLLLERAAHSASWLVENVADRVLLFPFQNLPKDETDPCHCFKNPNQIHLEQYEDGRSVCFKEKVGEIAEALSFLSQSCPDHRGGRSISMCSSSILTLKCLKSMLKTIFNDFNQKTLHSREIAAGTDEFACQSAPDHRGGRRREPLLLSLRGRRSSNGWAPR